MSQYTTLECISNTLGGNLMSNAYWTGVTLGQLLDGVGLLPTAQAVIFRSVDNYYESFPLELVLAPGVLLAHTMNGAALPDKTRISAAADPARALRNEKPEVDHQNRTRR